jgi:hypothetical protein
MYTFFLPIAMALAVVRNTIFELLPYNVSLPCKHWREFGPTSSSNKYC